MSRAHWRTTEVLHICRINILTMRGIGSALVESLTSYVARLADAHDVSIGTLVTREVLPKAREEFRRHEYKNPPIESTFLYDAHTLNGVVQHSQDWVSVLEQLTGVRGLQYLTMRTWRQVISGADLLRRRRAWCPLCLENWRGSNQRVYEPLLWGLKEVSVCPTHACPLVERCPHCGTASLTSGSRRHSMPISLAGLEESAEDQLPLF